MLATITEFLSDPEKRLVIYLVSGFLMLDWLVRRATMTLKNKRSQDRSITSNGPNYGNQNTGNVKGNLNQSAPHSGTPQAPASGLSKADKILSVSANISGIVGAGLALATFLLTYGK